LIELNTSRRRFLAASGMIALQSAIGAWPAAAEPDTRPIRKRFSFANGSGGLLPCFTDYTLGTEELEFIAEVRPLPRTVQPPGRTRNAYYIQANNHSDDMFMFFKGVVSVADGIQRNQLYSLSFDIWFASDANNCPGTLGSRDDVTLKAGGSTLEPVPLLLSNNYVSINVDKGDQTTGGQNLGVVGSIWNGRDCPIEEWVMLNKTYDHPVAIRSTDEGTSELWIAVGTESGFESLTGVYYYSIEVRLTPVPGTP
jgi:hypothetical protein